MSDHIIHNDQTVDLPQSGERITLLNLDRGFETFTKLHSVVEIPLRNLDRGSYDHEDDKEQEGVAEDDDDKMPEDIRIYVDGLMKSLNKDYSKSIACCVCQMPRGSCIYKVPRQLRSVNPDAYDPQLISIGPYHRSRQLHSVNPDSYDPPLISTGPYSRSVDYSNQHLQPMERHKKHCLKSFLARNRVVSLEKYVELVRCRSVSDKARKCYAESVDMTDTDFAEMMLLDGCFILELIRDRDLVNETPRRRDGQIFQVKVDLPQVAYDLLLLENQLPLVILEELFYKSKLPHEDESFVQKALSFFCLRPAEHIKRDRVKHDQHLLGLVYGHCVSKVNGRDTVEGSKSKHRGPELRSMRHAKALEEAGVKFQKVGDDQDSEVSLFQIEFDGKTGIMKIPTLRVDDNTERIFRNLIAYEQFTATPPYVSDYAVIMDCLINSDKDVELLHRQGVIANWLGDHEAVAKMFNRLCDHVKISNDFFYSELCEQVREYCGHSWNEWMATLRHDYFNNPWALISFLAAVVLLLTTVAQLIVSLV